LEHRKLKLSKSKVEERQASYYCGSLRDCRIRSSAMNSLQGAKKPPDPLLLPTRHVTRPSPAEQKRRDFLAKKLKKQSSGTRDTVVRVVQW